MKNIISVLFMYLVAGHANAYSLNAGDVAFLQFDSLTLTEPTPVNASTGMLFFVSYDPVDENKSGFVNSGESLRVELFENSLADTPFRTFTDFSWGADLAGFGGFYGYPYWEDLQGIIKFTMLSGYVELDSVSITITQPDYRYSGTFTVVPIPGAIWLFLSGLSLLFVSVKQKRALSAN